MYRSPQLHQSCYAALVKRSNKITFQKKRKQTKTVCCNQRSQAPNPHFNETENKTNKHLLSPPFPSPELIDCTIHVGDPLFVPI
ncbi:Uncharacterized protein TCM_000448 [Theobroma cacao]|uniref:Uncharacterized protein n=1 Tax=Theobroma cacao TaxID=3641 RepID=A0A061DHF9_THECC|nr:Uncharacterized protein TCM_000448 [Theobroma cacao]